MCHPKGLLITDICSATVFNSPEQTLEWNFYTKKSYGTIQNIINTPGVAGAVLQTHSFSDPLWKYLQAVITFKPL